jgi:ASC-1-like (ASCH) protein
MAIGNIVLMGPKLLANDLEHELVHVAQSMREPLIHPFLYQIENARKGYRKNKYEMEAYTKAGNAYVHRMKLQPNPFGKIKDGSKTIEIRLNDEKRQLINIGDEIIFTLATNELENIRAKVIRLSKFPTFKDLCMAFPPEQYGSESQEEYVAMYKYYSREDEQKYGVLAIEVKRLAS